MGNVVGGAMGVDPAVVVQDEAYWVSTAQLTCVGEGTGAIAETGGTRHGPASVHPYEANIGARALVAAGFRYLPMVAAYLRWYLGHLNRPDVDGVTGTVYDYDYDPVSCVGTRQRDPATGAATTYDSSDAYAGTFLTLVADYVRADPQSAAWIAEPQTQADLGAVADAIMATLRPSGLTAATPTYEAEYLLDNVEGQQGLRDYAWLLTTVVGDAAQARRRTDQADGITAAISTSLWRSGPAMYAVAAHGPDPSWSVWYPDSFAQLWPVSAGLGTPGRRAALWAAFARHWPGWTASTPAFGTVAVDHDPNAAVAYAAAMAGDWTAVRTYLTASQLRWAGHAPPWTVDDSGFRALAAQAASRHGGR
ncbi:MAG TPA: hypothetical protein VGE11_04020 [Pseudonocardia sp.]